jgi:cytochrome c553
MRINQVTVSMATALVLAGVACSTSDSDSLLGSGSYGRAAGGGGSTTGSSSGGPTGSTTVGTGDDDGVSSGSGSGGSTTGASTDGGFASVGEGGASSPQALFEALFPLFNSTCGNACHAQGGSNAPAYLGGADPYTTIKAFPGIVVATAQQSILLTKGAHEVPALTNPLEADLTTWLTAEAAALPSGPPETAPVSVAIGNNTVDLSKLGVAGVSLSFTAALSGNVMTLSSLQIAAPTTTGVTIAYPIFYVNGAGGAQTSNNDLSDDQQTVAAGTSVTLDTGILILSGWAAGDTIQIAFTKLAAAATVDAGTTGGCKSVASFTTNAVPAIQANTCLNCHNTGGSGNASLDLSGLAATPVNDTAACAQALSRINTAAPAQSDIILAPTGGVANHPFKNASSTFATMMETWIQAEK